MLVPHSDLVEGPQPMEGLSLTFTAIYSSIHIFMFIFIILKLLMCLIDN
jgi:hypothetical protein